MFSCEFSKISKSTFFTEHLRWLLLSLKVLENLLLVSSRTQMFYKIGIFKYSEAANGGAL